VARKRAKPSQSQEPSATEKAEDDQPGVNVEPRFDVTKVEGYIPVEQLKNGWTWPDYDPNEPEHERMALFLARILVKVQARRAAERRVKEEAEARTAEPKFVRLRRSRKRRTRQQTDTQTSD